MELTAEVVVSVVAGLIALALDVVPGLRQRWERLPDEVKRFAWLVGCLLIVSVPWLLYCLLGLYIGVVVVCTPEGLVQVGRVAFAAYFASQAVHGVAYGVQKLRRTNKGGVPNGQ